MIYNSRNQPPTKFSTRLCVELKPRYLGLLYGNNDDDDGDDEDDDARCNKVDDK